MTIYAGIFYVYYLIDPSTGRPFYVGKGKGRRAKQHLGHALSSNCKSLVYKKIKSIRSKGLEPKVKIRKLFEDEFDALSYEVFLISIWGRRINGSGCLFNQTTGGDGITGYRFTEEQKARTIAATKDALLKKYGVDNPSLIPEVAERLASIQRDKHGGKYLFETEGFIKSMEGKWNVLKINAGIIDCEHCGISCNTGNYRQHHGQNCHMNPDRPKYRCPHCGKESAKKANLTRYHFDNCRNA